MRFSAPWLPTTDESGQIIDFVPVLTALMVGADELMIEEQFIVDSGADISMAPRRRCNELGLDWESGKPMKLHGISPREECAVNGRVHDVEIVFPDADFSLIIPICFVSFGTTSFL